MTPFAQVGTTAFVSIAITACFFFIVQCQENDYTLYTKEKISEIESNNKKIELEKAELNLKENWEIVPIKR